MKRQILKKGNSGITLIALVITIIVLLILAGVAIASLTGENGILNRAGEASENTKRAAFVEEVQLALLNSEAQLNEAETESERTSRILGVLNTYFTGVPTDLSSSNLKKTLTPKNGAIYNRAITVEEVVNGTQSTKPTIVSFTMNGKSYDFEQGMTWEDLVNSSTYNTARFQGSR